MQIDESKLADLVERAVERGAAQALAKHEADTAKQGGLRTYQHAADWVRMVNSITWSIASFYLLSAVIAMNVALTRPAGSFERHAISATWIALLVLWAVVDFVYLSTARHARGAIDGIEKDAAFGSNFYTDQRRTRLFKGKALDILLGLTGLLLITLWIQIGWVWSDPPIAKIQMIQ